MHVVQALEKVVPPPLAPPSVAPRWRRVAGRVIDDATVAFLVVVIQLVILVPSLLLSRSRWSWFGSALVDEPSSVVPIGDERLVVLAGVGIAGLVIFPFTSYLYYVALAARWNGRTVGKRLLGTRVVSAVDGSSVDRRALERRWLARDGASVLMLLPPPLDLPAAGYQIVNVGHMLVDHWRRALHDVYAGTLVVREASGNDASAINRGRADDRLGA